VNLSGPRVFFFRRLSIASSISLFVIDLFRWLISAWSNHATFYYLKFLWMIDFCSLSKIKPMEQNIQLAYYFLSFYTFSWISGKMVGRELILSILIIIMYHPRNLQVKFKANRNTGTHHSLSKYFMSSSHMPMRSWTKL
jgi:hypothetical protein